MLEQISEMQDMTGSVIQSDFNPYSSAAPFTIKRPSSSNNSYESKNQTFNHKKESAYKVSSNPKSPLPYAKSSLYDEEEDKDEVITLTNSENSQDLRNFERKIKAEITYHQIGKYEIRCDKSIMK